VSKLSYQYDLLNLTPANAQPVEANFTRIEQHVNQELIERDGSVGMRSPLKLPGDPIADLDAAPKQYVDQVIPVGLVMMWAAAAPPANGRWLLCDGAPLQTAAYPELFAVIGYAWGGSGGTFNAPNYNGRVPLGVGAGHPMAQTGGSEDSSLPAHTHPMNHDHAGTNTGTISADHSHAVNIMSGASDRALGTSNNGDHNHAVPVAGQGFLVDGVTASQAGIQIGGSGYSITPFTTNGGGHTHAVTDHLHPVNGNTGGVSSNHTHTVNVPTFNGSTAQTGVAPTGTNMPPFLAISFIIRCK
jgi:microcystin-dependent protein